MKDNPSKILKLITNLYVEKYPNPPPNYNCPNLYRQLAVMNFLAELILKIQGKKIDEIP